jgi:Tfp pilus assembly protein PilE
MAPSQTFSSRTNSIIKWIAGIVVGILALFVLVTFIQVYRDRMQRGRITEAIAAAQPWMAAIEQYYQTAKRMPTSASDLPADLRREPSRYGRVSVGTEGALTITLTDAVGSQAGKTIIVTPQLIPGGLRFRCSSTSVQPSYLPGNCR